MLNGIFKRRKNSQAKQGGSGAANFKATAGDSRKRLVSIEELLASCEEMLRKAEALPEGRERDDTLTSLRQQKATLLMSRETVKTILLNIDIETTTNELRKKDAR